MPGWLTQYCRQCKPVPCIVSTAAMNRKSVLLLAFCRVPWAWLSGSSCPRQLQLQKAGQDNQQQRSAAQHRSKLAYQVGNGAVYLRWRHSSGSKSGACSCAVFGAVIRPTASAKVAAQQQLKIRPHAFLL